MPSSPTRHLRIGCVQFDPIFKDVKASIALADAHIASISPGQLDILVLPEMAFTGYCFTARSDIEHYLESPDSGPTFVWASSTAAQLGCYVLVGVPERTASSTAYNSLLIVSPQGRLVTTYRKHFLYETDESWAEEGPAFLALSLPFPVSSSFHGQDFKLCPCICMDLNPKGFIAPFDAFELATFADKQQVDLVVCAMNWLDSDPDDIETRDSDDEWTRVSRTLSYFALRLKPLLGQDVAFVACNRVGKETGSSVLMQLSRPASVIKYASKRRAELVLGILQLPARDCN